MLISCLHSSSAGVEAGGWSQQSRRNQRCGRGRVRAVWLKLTLGHMVAKLGGAAAVAVVVAAAAATPGVLYSEL